MEARCHDRTLYRMRNIDDEVRNDMVVNGRQFCIYGDPAYLLRPYLIVLFSGYSITLPQSKFNKSMARVWNAVKWGFKEIKRYFTHVDFPRKMTIEDVPVAKLFVVFTILWYFRV